MSSSRRGLCGRREGQVEERFGAPPARSRGTAGPTMGLDADWAARTIKAVGNWKVDALKF
jgi:hypothetical protein